MPPLPVIPFTYRVALRWSESTSGQAAVNVMHFSAGLSGTSPGDLAAALNSHVSIDLWLGAVSTARVQTLDIIDLNSSTGATVSFTTVGTGWGGAGSGEFVPNVPALVKFKTGLRGRSRRGRIYLPFQGEANIHNGQITPSSILTTANTAWVALQNGLQAGTPAFSHVVASYHPTLVAGGDAIAPITSYAAELLTASMRRRQPGRKVAR